MGVEPEATSVIDEMDQACTLTKKQVCGTAPGVAPREPRALTREALIPPDTLALLCSLPCQRLIGFGVCFSIGMVLNIVVRPRSQAVRLKRGVLQRASSQICLVPPQAWFLIFAPISYAVVFTFGNIISLCRHVVTLGWLRPGACLPDTATQRTRPIAPASCAAPRSSSRT